MVTILSDKLFQFENVRKGECREIYLVSLAEDIVGMIRKVQTKGLYYTSLTSHEIEVAEEVQEYYENNKLIKC